MDLGLAGKVALVTGGARDVGAEIARTLAREGAAVAVNYRGSKAGADATVAEIRNKGGKAAAYQADIADRAAVTSMVDAVIKDFGRIDVLVNNAGLAQRQRFLETTPEAWKSQIDVGLYGVIHCCHAVAPHMVRQKAGRIVNLAGDSARVGESGLSITAASRGGVIALTKSLAKELGRDGITVNLVALGFIETAHSEPEWLAANRDKIVRMYPLRRLGKPADVAPAVAFLASDAASWITGQVLSISGGYSTAG
ncbi:MAG TPA: 3-oxoacyl-ACP reductase family protein [Hyphomicrobiaceae bacterium]|jgi:NAD(P)-dependent dehydrogenase (short-subunit alcohol dehydrogenase family)|nr:3-oxoacyl-ACP reductase family protein [Hyphomicrobiaceae bacterium]